VVVLGLVLINGIIGFYQELKAKASYEFFRVLPPSMEELGYALIMPTVVFVALEIRKWVEYLYEISRR